MKNFTKVIVHSANGFEEQVDKFVEVEGKKFIDDGTGKPKLDDKQQPIPFVEKKVEKQEAVELDKLSVEELAEKNPHIKKMLEDRKKAEDDAKKAQEEEARKKGDFENLFKQKEGEVTTLKDTLTQKEEQLGKYVESVKLILSEVLKTIPKEKLSLIPEKFSPREKLEYITQNAKLLGANVVVNKDTVIKNEEEPEVTDEDKLRKEIDELMKKGATRTSVDNDQLFQKSAALKKLMAAKGKK